MKTLILVAALLASAMSQTKPECRCGFFVTVAFIELEIHRLPSIDLEGCDQEDVCTEACKTEADKLSFHGDLTAELSNGYNVGQELCLGALSFFYPNVKAEYVYGFGSTCNGPWIYTGFQTQQLLCCEGGRYFQCATAPTPLAENYED